MRDNTPVRGGFKEKFIVARYFLDGHGVEKSPELFIKHMKDAEEHITAVVGDSEAAKSCWALGAYYFNELHELKEAAHWYENAVRIDRVNPDAWYDLGICYDQTGRSAAGQDAAECYVKAAYCFRRAINTGISKGRRQKAKTALAAIEKKLEIIVISHGPLDAFSQYTYLDAGKKLDDMTDDELLKLSDAELEELASEPEAQYALYERYANMEERPEPGAQRLRYMNWLKRAADGQYEPAMKRWNYIIEGDPVEDAKTFWQLRTKAVNDVNDAYALYETGRSYLFGYGMDERDLRKAIAFLKRAGNAARSGDNDTYIAKARYLLGTIYTGAYYDKDDSYYKNNYHRQFEPEKAEKCFTEALMIDKAYKNVLYELCSCYEGSYGFDRLHSLEANLEQLRFYYNRAKEAGYENDAKFARFKGVIANMEIMIKEIDGLL